MTANCRSCASSATSTPDAPRDQGYITLYDGARRHFDRFAPGGKWKKGAGPCSLEEARERLKDPGSSLVPLWAALPRRHPHGTERAHSRLGGAPHQAVDAGLLARRHRAAAADARLPGLLGELARAGRAGRPIGLRSGAARRADARRSEIRPQLGRCQAHVG